MARTVRTGTVAVIVPGAHFRLLPQQEAGAHPEADDRGGFRPYAAGVRFPERWSGVHAVDAGGVEWPRWVPLVAAGGALSMGVAAILERDALFPPDWSSLGLVVLAIAPWISDLLGVNLPRLVFAAVVLGAVGALVATPGSGHVDMIPFLLVFLAAEIAATAPLATGALTAAAAIGLVLGFELFGGQDDSLPWFFGISFGWAGGFMVRQQVRLLQETRAAQATLTEKAAGEERRRIAREVHDVVAHSLSVTLLHLTGARRALETGGDPEEAVDALRDAERLGRQAMGDIRRTVGILEPGAVGETAAMPGLADVPDLVESFRAAGLAVAYSASGDASSVSPATSLGLFRIVQESLANVARHAPGAAAAVSLDLARDPVLLAVRNGPPNGAAPLDPGDHAGLGIEGMRQRAGLLGGRLSAGPHGDGWLVEAAVPRSAPVNPETATP